MKRIMFRDKILVAEIIFLLEAAEAAKPNAGTQILEEEDQIQIIPAGAAADLPEAAEGAADLLEAAEEAADLLVAVEFLPVAAESLPVVADILLVAAESLLVVSEFLLEAVAVADLLVLLLALLGEAADLAADLLVDLLVVPQLLATNLWK